MTFDTLPRLVSSRLRTIVIPSEARDLQLGSGRKYYVYIMASRLLNLYTGVTNNLYRRALQHKAGEIDGFTKRYNINRLVYYEVFEHIGNAIAREKQIKAWTRAKRLALIKTLNPAWQDLAEGWGERAEMQIPRFARNDIPGDARETEDKIARDSDDPSDSKQTA